MCSVSKGWRNEDISTKTCISFVQKICVSTVRGYDISLLTSYEGEPVGLSVDGASVGELLGLREGLVVGLPVTGDDEGLAVGFEVTGDRLGDTVGLEVVG